MSKNIEIKNEKKKADNIKVTSIANEINVRRIWQRFGAYLQIDILICVLLGIIFFYGLDVTMTGTCTLRYRTFIWEETSEETNDLAESAQKQQNNQQPRWKKFWKAKIYYQVGTTKNDILYEIEIGLWLRLFLIAGFVVVIVQLVHLQGMALYGARQVRRQLKPLNEIAAKAQELSNLAFDETKYHNLEDAISNLKVEAIDDGIHMHDKELRGIETALNNLLERIRISYKQQAQFVSDASHELRTPIAVIQGYINMLDRWGKDDEAILAESIEAIQNEANHMQKLVEQLLFLARGDSNRQSLDIKQHCLNDILKEVYEESLMIDEKHHYSFEEQGRTKVFCDSDMLKQSARILIDNAAKYTAEKEEIIIRVGSRADGAAFFVIQDNGIGMAQQDVEHVFDRFFRADAVRNSNTGGTGLGLSIAKWIVERHQGHFEITSREGIGTRFCVILPQAER